MIKGIGGLHCVYYNLLLYNNMLKQYSAACTRFTYEMEFKYTYACSGRESYISSTKSKTKLFSKTSHLLSPNRDPCVTILNVTV